MPRLTNDTDYPLDATLTGAEKFAFTEGTSIKKATLNDVSDFVGTAVNAADSTLIATGVAATDRPALTNAISAAAAGDVIRLVGDFVIDSVVNITSKTGLTLVATPGHAKITNATTNQNMLALTGSSDITIEGLKLVGGGVTLGAQTGIAILNGCSDVTIKNCAVTNMGYDGINALYDTVGLIVSGCRVTDCFDDGINPGGGGGSPGTTGSQVINNYVSGMAGDGIHVSVDSSHTTVTGNVIEDCDVGIGLFTCTHVTVTGNTINGSTTYGIATKAVGCTDVTITGNVIDGSTQGIRVSFNSVRFTVANNVVRSPSAYGIILSMTSSSDTRTVITGNVITNVGSTDAIHINNANDVLIIGNRIDTAGRYGVYLTGTSTDVNVVGNVITGTTNYGVIAAAASTDVVIEANKIRVPSRGIYTNAPRSFVIGNHVSDATDYGIVLSASALTSAGMIANNVVQDGCTAAGIFVTGYNGVVITGNRVTGITSGSSILGSGSVDFALITSNYTKGTISGFGAGSTLANNMASTGV